MILRIYLTAVASIKETKLGARFAVEEQKVQYEENDDSILDDSTFMFRYKCCKQ